MSNFTYSQSFQGITDLFTRRKEYYRPLLALLENVMAGESALSKVERELIASHVSAINSCQFCVKAHQSIMSRLGAKDELVNSVGEEVVASSELTPRMRLLLSFAEKLTLNSQQITKSDIEALTAAGIDEETIEDTVNVVALFNMLNRIVDAFGFEGNPEYFKMLGEMMGGQGYLKAAS